ncbi:MAG: GNAT family N-acetyltransferase, partial [Opitutaceae bacterium]|nr:GNAT family N-acetyltransferase [Opitutaceae bacterium]
TTLVIRTIDLTEKNLIAQILSMEGWLKGRLENLLREDGRCFVALDGDTVAGFNLVSFRKIDIPRVHFIQKLEGKEAFSEQITVHRDYRGRGLATRLRYKVYQDLLTQGINTLYGSTEITNTANLALSQKVGLKDIANIHYRKFLWKHNTTVEKLDS